MNPKTIQPAQTTTIDVQTRPKEKSQALLRTQRHKEPPACNSSDR